MVHKGISLITPTIGQITDIKNLPTQKKWWEKFIEKFDWNYSTFQSVGKVT